jgi:hypothetical protein
VAGEGKGNLVSHLVEARLRALAVAAAPLLLLIGFVIRPYVSNPRDPAVKGEALTAAPNRLRQAPLPAPSLIQFTRGRHFRCELCAVGAPFSTTSRIARGCKRRPGDLGGVGCDLYPTLDRQTDLRRDRRLVRERGR